MSIIKEDFVSFETAKLLKEKNCPDFGYSCICDSEGNKAQTQSIIMKWLREVHDILIIIRKDTYILEGFKGYFFVIESAKGESFSPLGVGTPTKVYEDAVEAAIKYSLKNLI